jgi:hypothetical protein
MTPEQRDALIEAVTSAHRTIDPFSRMARAHEAFWDLDEEARLEAYERTISTRAIEAAMNPRGLSTTARAVLSRITGSRS